MLSFSCFMFLELLGQMLLYTFDASYCPCLGDGLAHNFYRNSNVNYDIGHF